MKELDEKFLLYYVAKKIINNAEWDEALGKFYVEIKDEYISLNSEEYNYLKKLAKLD